MIKIKIPWKNKKPETATKIQLFHNCWQCGRAYAKYAEQSARYPRARLGRPICQWCCPGTARAFPPGAKTDITYCKHCRGVVCPYPNKEAAIAGDRSKTKATNARTYCSRKCGFLGERDRAIRCSKLGHIATKRRKVRSWVKRTQKEFRRYYSPSCHECGAKKEVCHCAPLMHMCPRCGKRTQTRGRGKSCYLGECPRCHVALRKSIHRPWRTFRCRCGQLVVTQRRISGNGARAQCLECRSEERAVISKHVRRLVMERDKHRCSYCGVKLTTHNHRLATHAHLDHVIPWSKGGTDEAENMVAACASCNLRKHASTIHPKTGQMMLL